MTFSPSSVALTFLLGLLFALTPLGTDTFLPAMPAIAVALNADPRTVQLAITTFFFGVALGQLVWGPLSDRYGRRPALFAGLAVFLAASIGCAASASASDIVMLRFVQGVGLSSGPVIARTVVRDLFVHEQAARLLSRMTIVFGLVPIFAPLAGGALVLIGWPAVFLFQASVGAALLVIASRGLAETAPAIGTALSLAELRGRFITLLRDRRFVLPAARLLCMQSGVVAFVSGSAFVMVRGFGVSVEAFAALFAVVMLGQIAGAWLSSHIVIRVGMQRLQNAGIAGGCVAAVVLASLAWADVHHWLAVVGPMFCYMFANSLVVPNATAAALSPFPRLAGSASSLLGCLQFAIGAATSAVLAALFDGSARPMASAICLLALGALALRRFTVAPAST